MFNIEEELKKLPAKPGVYLMHDKKDAIIYVGKAISLNILSQKKNRPPISFCLLQKTLKSLFLILVILNTFYPITFFLP